MDRRMFRDVVIPLSMLLCGCAVTPSSGVTPEASAPPPQGAPSPHFAEGAWRVSGASGAMFSKSEIDDVDQTTFGIGANAGKMISNNVLVEGNVEYTNTDTDVGGADLERTDLILGAGVRYYFDVQGNTVPYFRGMAGLLSVDVDAGAVDDDDTSPYLGGGIGAETFLTESIGLDYGFRLIYAFDVFDEEFTDLGVYVGVSVWL
jgi:opacity protein-like surface antigen